MPTFSGIVPNLIRDPYFDTFDGWNFVNISGNFYTRWFKVEDPLYANGMLLYRNDNTGISGSVPNGLYAWTNLIKSWSVGDTIRVTLNYRAYLNNHNIQFKLIALNAAGSQIGSALIDSTVSATTGTTSNFDVTSSAIPANTETVQFQILRTDTSVNFHTIIRNVKAKKANNLSSYHPRLIDVVKLEIEPAPSANTNKLKNAYSAIKGGLNWITPVEGTRIQKGETVNHWIGWRYDSVTGSVPNEFISEPMPCTPGNWISGRFESESSTGIFRVRIEFLSSNPTVVNRDGDIGSNLTITAGAWNNTTGVIAPEQAPSNATLFRLRVEIGDSGGGFPMTAAGQNIVYTNVQVYENTVNTIPDELKSTQWIDLMTSGSEVVINRRALNLGTLTATILDKRLDPLEATHIRPGHTVQMLVFNASTDKFEPMFIGEADVADVAYDATYLMTAPNANETATITLVAVDGQRSVSGAKRPFGVAEIGDLPFVLEGCGIEWDADGERFQILTPTTVSRNDSATALDQVVITRDSVAGYAWIDRFNKIVMKSLLPYVNYAQDGSFETGNPAPNTYITNVTAGLNFSRVKVANASSGQYVLRFTGNIVSGSTFRINSLQDGSFIENDPVSVRFRARVIPNGSGTRNLNFGVLPFNGGAQSGSLTATRTANPPPTTQWQEYVFEGATMPAATSDQIRSIISFSGSGWNSGDIFEIDDFIMVKRLTLADVIFDGPTYSNIEPYFNTEGLINELTFKILLPPAGDQSSEEITVGPFQEANSISEWGRHSMEYRIHGYTTDPAPGGVANTELSNLIKGIFSKNAYAKVRVDQLTVPITDTASLKYAILDLYNIAQIINTSKAINEYSVITGIRHTIQLNRWDTDFIFDDIESVAGSIATREPPSAGLPKISSRINTIANTPGTTAAGVTATKYTFSSMAIPENRRLALASFVAAARATANAACYWRLEVQNNSGSWVQIAEVRRHNDNDPTTQLDADIFVVVDLAELGGVSTLNLRVNCTNDPNSASVITHHPGTLMLTWL